jgi:hypothetical protein
VKKKKITLSVDTNNVKSIEDNKPEEWKKMTAAEKAIAIVLDAQAKAWRAQDSVNTKQDD